MSLFRRKAAPEIIVPELVVPAPGRPDIAARGLQMTRVTHDGKDMRVEGKTLTPDGFPIVEFPPAISQVLRLYGLGANYAQIYATQPNVRTCVDVIAREAAELQLKMYQKVPRSPLLPSDRIEIPDHDMALLLDEPTPGQSTYRFWYSTFADIEVFDRAMWLKIRPGGPGTYVKALTRIPPQQLWPLRDPLTGVITLWYSTRGLRIQPEDLVVFWGYDPQVNHGYIPRMETLRRLLAEDVATGQNREGMWKNSLRKDGIIEQDPDVAKMSDSARESYLIDVADALAGAGGSGLPMMLEPGQHWKDSVWSPRDMEYINARRLSRVECASSFHIPPAMISAAIQGQEPDDQTLRVFYQSSLPPRLARVEQEIVAQLLPDFDFDRKIRRSRYVEFNLDAKLRGSFETQAAIGATTAGGPVVTVNEVRARLNLSPVDGGDDIYMPLNSVRAGGPQASPQNPTGVPGGGTPVGTTPGGGTTLPPGAASGDYPGQVTPTAASIDAEIKDVRDRVAAQAAKVVEAKAQAEHALFMKDARVKYEEAHVRVMEKFFARQSNGTTAGKAADSARWNKELSDDLFGVAYQAVEFVGGDAATRIKGVWDPERTANFLRTNSDNTAAEINAQTASFLADDTKNPEAIYSFGRVDNIARTRTTFVLNWAVQEAAHQNGA